MDLKNILRAHKLEPYVKDIFVLENEDRDSQSRLPFFADGCPGIMLAETENGAHLYPKNKTLSAFFLYGQTLEPIEIAINGTYKLIVFQLYPFAAKTFFGVNPKELNDDCFDLVAWDNDETRQAVNPLLSAVETGEQLEMIARFLSILVQQTLNHKEQMLQLAINMVLNNKGKITVQRLRDDLHVTERTLQRQFIEYVGLSPKQFIKVVQFQFSMEQIAGEGFSKLTEISYENGYADQSHFIRDFKKFTGKTPSEFKTLK